MIQFRCTCRSSPTCVDLSSSLPSSSTSTIEQRDVVLRYNLSTFGWSPVRICNDELPCNANRKDANHPPFMPPTQDEIVALFDAPYHEKEVMMKQVDSYISYITAESGNGDSASVEPKESYELALRKIPKQTRDEINITLEPSMKIHAIISRWCQSLQYMVQRVEQLLEFPSQTFVETNPYASLDLLRVFYYHHDTPSKETDETKTAGHNQEEDLILGSSPHTDWGSFTMVWQDDVGGLQTYCQACQHYVDVPPPVLPVSENDKRTMWYGIVHVGDVTSLALNHPSVDTPSSASKEKTVTSKTSDSYLAWPSPRHRVILQPNRKRTSLVYFAYPPAHKSLNDLQHEVEDWKKRQNFMTTAIPALKEEGFPHQEYYLLKNQATKEIDFDGEYNHNGSNENHEEFQVYTSICHQPLGQVFQEKWNQVQRG